MKCVINKIVNVVTKHKMPFRILCILIALGLMITIILGFFTKVIPEWTISLFILFYYISIIPIAIIGVETLFDNILYFFMTLYSLFILSGVFATIINSLFNNEYITIYFWISSFFIFSYVYEISFTHSIYGLLLKKENEALIKSSALIGYMCNIVRIIILILAVFDTQYNLGLKNYPISEAIVTSLAFEKIIKGRKSKK